MVRRRNLLILLALPALAACGFAPAYGPGGDASALRGAVLAAEPSNDYGFAFVRRVEERLGLPEAPRFELAYVLGREAAGLAIDGSQGITRVSLEGIVTWTLSPIEGGEPITSGREIAFVAYSVTGSTIATLESSRDAEARLAALLADKAVAKLLAIDL
jgi:LPS-assembly lipoprotein